MLTTSHYPLAVCFGVYEVGPLTGELRKKGYSGLFATVTDESGCCTGAPFELVLAFATRILV